MSLNSKSNHLMLILGTILLYGVTRLFVRAPDTAFIVPDFQIAQLDKCIQLLPSSLRNLTLRDTKAQEKTLQLATRLSGQLSKILPCDPSMTTTLTKTWKRNILTNFICDKVEKNGG